MAHSRPKLLPRGGAFAAADDPRAGRPSTEVQQRGELDDLTIAAGLTVGADRRDPGAGGDPRYGVLDLLIHTEADGVADAPLAAASHERVGRTGAVGPDQDLRTTARDAGGPAGVFGELRQGQVQHGEVISGCIAPGVPGPQDRSQGLTAEDVGAAGEDQQRMEPEAVLVARGGAFLLAVRSQQARIDVQDQAGDVGQVRSATGGPDPGPGVGSRSTQRPELNGTDPVQDPISGRVRGDRTEQGGLIPERGQIRKAVPTIGEGDSQVGQNPELLTW